MKLPAFFVLLPAISVAAVWPEAFGSYQRIATSAAAIADKPLWDELGLKSAEAATYESGNVKFTAIAYRLADTTASMAAFDWQRPPDAKDSDRASLAAESAKGLYLVHGNYLLVFQEYKPSAAELMPILDSLHDLDTTPLPTLPGFLPSEGLIPNSERYITGPAALEKFDPAIPPSVAAFHLGAEAALGAFRSPKGDMTLALFNYPTNQIAMQKEGDFQKLSGAVVKRAGPLLAVILSPSDADAAERLLARVRYNAQITLDERVPTSRDNPGVMLVNIFVLIGILLAFAVVSGLFVGGFRALLWRSHRDENADPMILLHLERR